MKSREKIIDAAIKCFVKSGVAQTKISEIAKKAGVDQPLISYYFPTLDDLHEGVIMEVLRILREASVRPLEIHSTDIVQALSDYARAPFHFARDQGGLFSIWMYFYYRASHHALFQKLNSEIRLQGRERISSLIFRGLEEKQFSLPKGMKVGDVALNIQGLITGNTIIAGTEKHNEWNRYIEQTVAAIMTLLQVRS